MQVNYSIIKATVWPGQDSNEISLENYQVTSKCFEVTESTNKASKGSETGCQLNNTKKRLEEKCSCPTVSGECDEM